MEASRAKPLFGAIRHPVPDSRAEETGRQVGEAGRDTQVTFTFHEWASAKATAEQPGNVFTGVHPLRSLTSAARPVLAVLRHIRSSVRCLRSGATNNTSSHARNGGFKLGTGYARTRNRATRAPKISSQRPCRFTYTIFCTFSKSHDDLASDLFCCSNRSPHIDGDRTIIDRLESELRQL